MDIDDKSVEVGHQSTSTTLCHFCNEPITKMNGHDSYSLCNHHITYDPEITVPAHFGCNVRYHRTHPTDTPYKSMRDRYIERLGDNVICHFCGESITKKYGRDSESLDIHSLDGNHDNWDPDNKVPAHAGCHDSYHSTGERNVMYGKPNYWGHHTEEAKRLIGDSKRGKKRDPGVMRRVVVTTRARYGMAMCSPEADKERSKRMRENSPQKDHDTVMKGVRTRFERHGPSGCRDNELRKEKIGDANRGNSQIGIKGWITRRKRYPPNGIIPRGQIV